MPAQETALILIQPDDSTDTVLEKMLRSGAARVQILVPDGAIGLRTVAQTNRLRQMAEWAWIDLTLVSSDPATIGSAWVSQIQLMVVCETQVVPAMPPLPPGAPVEPRPALQAHKAPLPPATLQQESGAPSPQREPRAVRRQEPVAATAHARAQRGAATRQRTDHRPLRSGALPRLPRREPNRPRPRRGGHTR